MKRHLVTLLLVALFSGIASGQDRHPNRPNPQKPATEQEVEALRQAVTELKKQVDDLRAQLDVLIESLRTAKTPEAKAHAGDAAKAAQGGKLAVGMTLEQVKKLADRPGTIVEQNGNAQRWQCTLSDSVQLIPGNKPAHNGLGTYTLVVDFENGRATGFRQIDNHDN